MSRRKKLPLYIQILIGMAAGIVAGILLTQLGLNRIVIFWIKPFGDIFINLLKLVAVPLVIFSLLKGIGNLSDISRLSQMGIKTIAIYLATTIAAVCLGLGLALLIQPGNSLAPEDSAQLQQTYQNVVSQQNESATALQEKGPLEFLTSIVPDNIVAAMGNNGNMLQIIFISILTGIAIVLCGKEKMAPFMKLIDALDTLILKTVDLIMLFAPIGVFALMSGIIADSSGNLSILGALGIYALTVIAGLVILITLFYPALIHLFTRVPVKKFFQAMMPVQLLAFSTSSSAATLPLTMEKVEKDLKIPNEVTSFVLPVGVTINMDGTSCYQAIAAIFIAQVMGIELGWIEILTLIATTTISSIGTPGIPGGSVVILIMVLASIGVPPEGMALILGIDRPLDMMRTVVNVTGDATVASIIAAGEPEQR
ncbi:MAG TPA: dicarboxylate/amino acid:cation symporter [Candidatus Gallibacteroides avistercoris]|uniref:Dicarboxylate/amino acid:cation symporter n=1 Tax=Candidatus Gallibacteroides avistercoris TaxID=2840833 RepID=A0A9D1M6Y2_9BACT|nr:dicarboxylate/amino acid:cation symporter [Candidatus Gallibacteroides avistercoris]